MALYNSSDDYNPNKKTAAALDRAYQLIKSVPYQVSARWVFYRLLQEGFYSAKSDYKNKWCKASSNARHAFYKGWRPDTLADETREAITRGRGYRNVESWLEDVSDFGVSCSLDRWYGQENYIELWYEARAMTDQFRHYTEHITLRPMGGQPSIPYKWATAKDLERAAERYEAPIVILYFGDLDPAGETISEVVERDVRKWCKADFDFIHCGLLSEHIDLYNVPENPEKPGQYQWEALDDQAAKEIIENNTRRFLRHGALSGYGTQESEAEAFVLGELAALPEKWQDKWR